jgi:signal transduction histidine kinase
MALAWRTVAVLGLCADWLVGGTGPAGLVLVLTLCIMTIARWRYELPAWTVVFDQAACIAAMTVWPDAAYGLIIPLFDAVLFGAPWFAIPSVIAVIVLKTWSLELAGFACAAALAGWCLRMWRIQVERARSQSDSDRRERFALESLEAELVAANIRVQRMAELSERARIARTLHDHAGHELTAADLALQAFEQLWKDGDPQAAEMLSQARRRLSGGVEILRTTVHGLAPRAALGIDALEEICGRFTAAEVVLSVHGDTDRVPVHAWGVMEPCLKEALTNAARHAHAERVEVSIDVGPFIVRLSVHTFEPCPGSRSGDLGGLGLRSLRQRAHAVGGSITTDTTNGFDLICVLPLGEERT